jgi:DNA-binding GntR family transcriptional regulator
MDRQPLPLPLYHKVFGLLYQRIVHGSYPPGSRLETEGELATAFGVSRATVRQAVAELVKRGMVVRQQGRGTFVTGVSPASEARIVGELGELIRETAFSAIKSSSLRHRAAIPADVARRLNCDEMTGTVVERIRNIGDEVFTLTRQYLPGPIGELLNARDLNRFGVIGALHRKGVKLGEGHITMRAEVADIDVAEGLGIEIGAPILFAERILNDVEGAPVELVRAWYRSDLYEYRAAFRLVATGNRIEAEVI